MKISCPSCLARFALDDKRVPPGGLSIKCPKCAQAFSVQPPAPGEESKVVAGVPLSATGAMRVPAAQDTLVEKSAHGDAGDTLIDARAQPEVGKETSS